MHAPLSSSPAPTCATSACSRRRSTPSAPTSIAASSSPASTIRSPRWPRPLLAAAPERFTLIGLSLGGYLAFEVMRRAPARVERLALLDTTAAADSETRRAGRLADIATVEAGGIDALIPQLPGRWLLPRTSGATT